MHGNRLKICCPWEILFYTEVDFFKPIIRIKWNNRYFNWVHKLHYGSMPKVSMLREDFDNLCDGY